MPTPGAARRLARYAELYPHPLDQKARVIVDHYPQVVRQMLGGEAKAMVVAASRHDAVRYKQALDRVIEKGTRISAVDGAVMDAALDVRGINDLFIQKFLDDLNLRERVSEGVLRRAVDAAE